MDPKTAVLVLTVVMFIIVQCVLCGIDGYSFEYAGIMTTDRLVLATSVDFIFIFDRFISVYLG